ncbi:MAG: septal ring lytic transglycosylase RlpA family protein [Chlorobiota bacterium]|nr:MAG: septal ring lytic transglycosylase RlpA family protein [Chlorobiota bacterium]
MQRTSRLIAITAAVLLFTGCASAVRYRSVDSTRGALDHVTMKWRGIASYYHDNFEGRLTASGELFRQNRLTAAHPFLPMGTIVRVVNLQNGRSTVVRINDRGPHVPGRIIDLSRAAAMELGIVENGTVEVEVSIVAGAQ